MSRIYEARPPKVIKRARERTAVTQAARSRRPGGARARRAFF